jgi:hypothetical protein
MHATLKLENLMGDLGAGGKIILKWIEHKHGMRVCLDSCNSG